MITICTNSETARITLEDALAGVGATAVELASILDQCSFSSETEDDFWIGVMRRLDFPFETDGNFAHWHGGNRRQFGGSCGLAHSDVNIGEANLAWDAIIAAARDEAIELLASERAAALGA